MEIIPESVELNQVEVWFQDETRVGQQGSLSRIWAKKGTRPRVVRQQQFLCQYIYGAVCPEQKKAASIIGNHTNTEMMNLHLEEISLHVEKGKHAVLLMDQAGWHKSQDLQTPSNISILHLPPYSPELNPQENVWQVIKDKSLKNRVYESLEEITESACNAWNQWVSDPEQIKNTCSRKWTTLC